jgi:succinate dehydrogenase flavin-adding protein (antitoxin of CptAB toxin-antitoxin module)
MSKQQTQAAFRLVIEKNNIDENLLSKPIKGYIRDYMDVQGGIDQLESLKEKSGGELSEDDQRELDEFIEALEEKDKDLVKRINHWIANAEVNKQRGAKLAEGKKKAQEQRNIAAGLNADGSKKTDDTPPTPNPQPDPKPNTPPAPNPLPEKKVEEIPIIEPEEVPEEKESKGFWGWIAAAVIIGVGVLVGVKMKNNQ